ncbi:UpxY family transcription antiterminator [Pontibacter chinhatensis]|uniref:Transcription antitermination factor NusG n=1 Tax=Pontibacter chinhatensis TaxID=1436961 RepID=A0A1I2N575_9BACT|nr:UpxY family transcription antiterminator [Pontibacter chinhatensis]SFF96551.1 Transcription antitermination factor NusG [Pontibacter chinhatensis]
MTQNWYAVYTKPRWEKKVAQTLTQHGIQAYCPINRVVRQWSDRKKIIHAPLFTSYVFVRITEKQIADAKKVEGVINLVYWLGKPAIIRDEEIEIIRQFLAGYENVQLEKAQFRVNDKVKMTSGLLSDKEGTVVAVKNNTVKVALPSLHYIMFAEVEKSDVAKVSSIQA